MKDQQLQAGSDHEDSDTKTMQSIKSLSSANADDEYASVHELDVPEHASNASYSLGVLESDLRALHAKWEAVEKVMSERDAQIANLEVEVDKKHERAVELEKEIEDLRHERSSLSNELDVARDQIESLHNERVRFDDVVAERERALEAAKVEIESLEEKCRDLQTTINQQSEFAETYDNRVAALENERVNLRVQVQELQDYIDRRKSDWDSLNDRLKSYEETIDGMSNSLESHDEVVALKEEEKSGLALKIMELEREIAEIRGRYTEKELLHSELQESLAQKSSELGKLNGEIIRLHKDIAKLEKKLNQRDSAASSVKRNLEESERDRASLEELLSTTKANANDLQTRLDAATHRVEELESQGRERDANTDELSVTIGELRERLKASQPTISNQEARIAELEGALNSAQAIEEDLRAEAMRLSEKLQGLGDTATDQQIRTAELESQLLESESERKAAQDELEAQRELVHVLEQELNKKQQNLDVLDRSVDRLSAIGHGIRDLDMQIDDLWLREPEPPADLQPVFDETSESMLSPGELIDSSDEFAEHVIVAEHPDGGEPTRFPLLQQTVTIGRSHGSDIRINSKYISRIHARITVDGERAVIEDAGSTNGFYVNSVQTNRHTLKDGDALEIGDSKLRYVHVDAAS